MGLVTLGTFFITKQMLKLSAGRAREPELALFPNSCCLFLPPLARPKGRPELAGRGPGNAQAVTYCAYFFCTFMYIFQHILHTETCCHVTHN